MSEQDGAVTRRSRGRPRQQDVAEIESALLDVALREFLAHGYGGASITRIVRTAGVSKTTVYSRFTSKEQLFHAVMDRQVARLSAEGALRGTPRRLDLEAGLIAYGDRTLEISLQGDLLQVNRLIYSESHRFPELGATAVERNELGVQQVATFIADCATANAMPCRRPRVAAEAFIFMLRGWYVTAMLANRPVPAEERRAWVCHVVHVLISRREDW